MANGILNLDDFLPYRLSYSAGLASEVIAEAYRTLFGLGIPEWRVIAHVAAVDGITQQAIGTATRMDKVTVSRAAVALVDRGLIARRPNPVDRRSHLLVLTQEGARLHAEIAPKALDLETQLFDGFDAAEIAAFGAMLRRIDERALALAGGNGAARYFSRPASAPVS